MIGTWTSIGLPFRDWEITSLPFNQLVSIEHATTEGFLLSLPAHEKYHNHLGTVHASALLSLAEATSGEFLIRHIGDVQGVIPVVRRMEAKFKKPGQGKLLSRANSTPESLENLESKGRATIEIAVEAHGEDGTIFLTASFEWFIAQQK